MSSCYKSGLNYLPKPLFWCLKAHFLILWMNETKFFNVSIFLCGEAQKSFLVPESFLWSVQIYRHMIQHYRQAGCFFFFSYFSLSLSGKCHAFNLNLLKWPTSGLCWGILPFLLSVSLSMSKIPWYLDIWLNLKVS